MVRGRNLHLEVLLFFELTSRIIVTKNLPPECTFPPGQCPLLCERSSDLALHQLELVTYFHVACPGLGGGCGWGDWFGEKKTASSLLHEVSVAGGQSVDLWL